MSQPIWLPIFLSSASYQIGPLGSLIILLKYHDYFAHTAHRLSFAAPAAYLHFGA